MRFSLSWLRLVIAVQCYEAFGRCSYSTILQNQLMLLSKMAPGPPNSTIMRTIRAHLCPVISAQRDVA